MTDLEKRLVALSDYGIVIHHNSGHRWLECVDIDGYNFSDELRKHGIYVNNKIYGGVLECLDVIDRALVLMKQDLLLQHFENNGLKVEGRSDYAQNRVELTNGSWGGLC